MPENDTLFVFPPHTDAKHRILRKYIEAWAPILCQSSSTRGRVVYIDGFAGPGEDITQSKIGSPLIALEAVANHSLANRFRSEVVFYFIEKNMKRAQHLESIILRKFSDLPSWIKWEVEKGRDFNNALNDVLVSVRARGSHLAPTFCFVDPFGWQDLNYGTLSNLMREPRSELLITFMSGFMNRFLESERHQESLINIFSDTQMGELKNTVVVEERTELMLYFFAENLKSKCGGSNDQKELYSIGFRTRDHNNNTLYHLLYLTSNEKGMDVMKKAMYTVARDGSYLFSDFEFNPTQKSLLDYSNEKIWIGDAAEEVRQRFKGREVSQTELQRFVTCYTKWIFEKKILRVLEQNGDLEYKGKRFRKFTYPDDNASIIFR